MNLMQNEGLEGQPQPQFITSSQIQNYQFTNGSNSVLRSAPASSTNGQHAPSPNIREGLEGFTCSQCGKAEYRNGEFQTIKFCDIFTHINDFPTTPSNSLCSGCASKGQGGGGGGNTYNPQGQPLSYHNHSNNHQGHQHIVINNGGSAVSQNNNEVVNSPPNNVKLHHAHSPLNGTSTIMHHHYNNNGTSVVNAATAHPSPSSVLSPGQLSDTGGLSCGSNISAGAPNNLSVLQQHHHDAFIGGGSPGGVAPPRGVLQHQELGPFSRISSYQTDNNNSPSDNPPNSHVYLPVLSSTGALDPKGAIPVHSQQQQQIITVNNIKIEAISQSGSENSNSPYPAYQNQLSVGSTGSLGGHEKKSKSPGSKMVTKGESGEEPRRVPCALCKKTFKNQKMASIHLKRVHEKANRFVCEVCGVSFSYRGSLDSHLASHNPPEVTHDCPTCGQKFKEKSNLHKHIRYHTDNPKKFLCEHCPSGFSKRVNLRYHIKRKHPEVAMNNNNITQLSASDVSNPNNPLPPGYYSTSSLKPSTPPTIPPGGGQVPTPPTTNGNKPGKPTGDFKCDQCGRGFCFKNNLKAHARTHTREKKYTCEICQKSFIYKESLKNHMLLHSNELPYLCDICGKKFRDRSNRRKHVKNVHKYMFVNGDINNPIRPAPNSADGGGSGSGGSVGSPSSAGGGGGPVVSSSQGGMVAEPPAKKTKKGGGNKKAQNPSSPSDTPKRSIIKAPRGSKKSKAASATSPTAAAIGLGSPHPQPPKSVIVTASSTTPGSLQHQHGLVVEGTPGLLDRKIIMSPSPNKNANPSSPLEYLLPPPPLPVTVHVPLAGPSGHLPFGGGGGRNVIVKVSSTSQSMSPVGVGVPSDLYDHGQRGPPPMQNVIVYPKPKELGQHPPGPPHHHGGYHGSSPSVISQNIHQYYSSVKQEQEGDGRTNRGYIESSGGNYLSLQQATSPSPLHHPQHQQHPHHQSQSRSNTSTPGGFEYIMSTTPPAGGEGDMKLFASAQQAPLGINPPQYSALYSTDPYHHHQQQYWTSPPPSNAGPGPPGGERGAGSGPSSPYDGSSHPITSASNVLNAPTYGQPHAGEPILDPNANGSNSLYKELSQFDFSYL